MLATEDLTADLESDYVSFDKQRISTYQKEGLWRSHNHIQFLDNIQQKYGNNTAVIDGNKQLTYTELYTKARQFGSYLKSQNLKKDDFIILQAPNTIEFFIVLFAIYTIGARPIFCLDGYGAYEIENIAKQSKAVGYIKIKSVNAHQDDAMDIINKFAYPNFTLWYRETITVQETIEQSLPMITEDHQPLDISEVSATKVAFLQLSGGTTGIPKLIPRTHADYLYSVKMSADIAGVNEQTKQLVVLPVMHNYAMSSPGFLGVFYKGATVILTAETSPRQCFKLMQNQHVTQVSLVPSLMSLWINSPALPKYDLSSLKVIQVGGAKLLPEMAKKVMQTLDITLQQVYGMAEGLVCFTRLDDDEQTIIHTQGRPLSPRDVISIIAPNGSVLSHGEVGQIMTKGPYTINGYYNSPLINKDSFTPDGFYKTGDLGYLDNQQNIVITGRGKEQINRAGEKIAPSELENLILTHDAVKDSSVVGIADARLGEKIKVFVVLKDESRTLTLQTLRTHLMQKNIAHYKLPDELELVTDFQYTLVGKVRK
ncbi:MULTISPECIES: (2,3-dihydroxybenzoyl)adenylate synthase [unclassified Psychrobacter]|uniref:(2,3-dihydroxybenzoyl)adenylate synthase n=1 Tax=unclassified Psychrobacter TaxID=196806 RepID=UPI0007159E40|nr:AMP-binding protein [Psychrobacter sp. P11F6]KRG34105.1 2,3-dihydroxybenzoate--AMP ligase [Psychrobacter sp. P11F6]